MSKKLYILGIGIAIALIQFLGIPGSWKAPLTVLLGLSVSALAFLIKQEEVRATERAPREGDVHVENGVVREEEHHDQSA